MNILKKYWDTIYLFLLLFIPIACICAGIYYTVSRINGLYGELSRIWLVIFDSSQFIYLMISLYFIRQRVQRNIPLMSLLPAIKKYTTISLCIQYNFIVHLFATEYVWTCTFIFFVIIVFFMDFQMMLLNTSIYIFSLSFAHVMHSGAYLPLDTPHYWMVLSYRIVIVLIVAFFLLMLTKYIERFLARTQMEEEENQFLMEKQLEYYQNLDIMDKELRKFRHDIKNHFLCLQTLSENGRTDELKNYFEDLQTSYNNQRTVYLSGNIITDSILNYNLSRLQNKKIQPVVYGKLPEITTVSAMDLCTIFSNLLSNAVTAVKISTADTPVLIIHFEYGDRFFSITVTNSSCPAHGTETIPLRRRDRNHGYGIPKIQEIVQKYQGIFEWNAHGEQFTSKIYLPI